MTFITHTDTCKGTALQFWISLEYGTRAGAHKSKVTKFCMMAPNI